MNKDRINSKSKGITKKPSARVATRNIHITKKPAVRCSSDMNKKVNKKPAAKLNPSQWIAKKGLSRLAKRPRGGPVLRRPSAIYTKFRSINGKVAAGRKDRMKTSATIKSFFCSKGDFPVTRKLVKDGMLRPTTRCHACGAKMSFYSRMEVRCTCRARCKRWEEHPVLSFHGNSMPMADQATLFMMALHNVANHTIHTIGGFAHAAIERFKSNLRTHISQYVIEKQKGIKVLSDLVYYMGCRVLARQW